MILVGEEEYLEWRNHPITKEFFKKIKKQREIFKEDLICNLYDNEDFVKGKALLIQEILEMSYSEFKENS